MKIHKQFFEFLQSLDFFLFIYKQSKKKTQKAKQNKTKKEMQIEHTK